jgi:hypothetical protein
MLLACTMEDTFGMRLFFGSVAAGHFAAIPSARKLRS